MGLLASHVSWGWKLKFGSTSDQANRLTFCMCSPHDLHAPNPRLSHQKKLNRPNINQKNNWNAVQPGNKIKHKTFLMFAVQTKRYSIKTNQMVIVRISSIGFDWVPPPNSSISNVEYNEHMNKQLTRFWSSQVLGNRASPANKICIYFDNANT